MYICICNKVTDTQIYREVEDGARSLNDLNERLGVASQCGKCGQCARNLIKEKVKEIKSFPVNFVY